MRNPDNRAYIQPPSLLHVAEALGTALLVEGIDTVGLSHLFHTQIGLNVPTVVEGVASLYPAFMTLGAVHAVNINFVERSNSTFSIPLISRNGLISASIGLVASQALPGWEGVVAGLASASPTAIATYQMARAGIRRN